MGIMELFAASTLNSSQSSDYLDGLIKYFASVQAIAIILFFICVIFYIRWWFVQSAVFKMSDDLREIKEYLVKDIFDSVDEDNLAETSPTTKEEIVLNEEPENQPEIIPKDSIKIGAILNKKLPKWMLIVFFSIVAIFIFAIFYINIFL